MSVLICMIRQLMQKMKSTKLLEGNNEVRLRIIFSSNFSAKKAFCDYLTHFWSMFHSVKLHICAIFLESYHNEYIHWKYILTKTLEKHGGRGSRVDN